MEQPAQPAARRILVVANRLPVTARVGDRVTLHASSGGLASALGRVGKTRELLWLGWPGDLTGADPAQIAEVGTALAARGLAPVHLSDDEVTRYYEGFSNSVLWPLFHYLIDKLALEADADWDVYRDVNDRFAAVTAEHMRPDDLVWIHDYQLCLVPGALRRRVPGAFIGFFLHIPFPALDVFRILPWRRQLLEGLVAADVIGFHTATYRDHFAQAAITLLGAEPCPGGIRIAGRQVRLGVYPIGVDTERFEAAATSADVETEVAKLRAAAPGKVIVLGIDRLDYTKGVMRRLRAIARLLHDEPALRERLHFIQLAVPTRERIDAYAMLRRQVNEAVGRINSLYGSATSAPIHLMYRSVPFTELVALYRVADVMLVTPLRDGMNLVAKEYVASRVDGRGVLVLSELAGAASELDTALLVNPYDVSAVARAVRTAMELSELEQRDRMAALRTAVRHGDVHAWADAFLSDLGDVGGGAEQTDVRHLSSLRDAPRRLLLLDYDGTLVPLALTPSEAAPDRELLALLLGLASSPGTEVHVVSGRPRDDLDRWLGSLPVGLHAEHGFWSRGAPGAPWIAHGPLGAPWLEPVRRRLEATAAQLPGSFVEGKSAGMALHYRRADKVLAETELPVLRRWLAAELPPDAQVLEGAMVIEVRVRGVDKGEVARRVLAAANGAPAVLAVGDDRTDEDLFLALGDRAVTFRVGPGASAARHRLADPGELRRLLASLCTTAEVKAS